MSEPYRDELEAALAQVAALRAENERLKAPKVSPPAPAKPTALSEYRTVIGISILLAVAIGSCTVAMQPKKGDTDRCMAIKDHCPNPGGIGCSDTYRLRYHYRSQWMEDNDLLTPDGKFHLTAEGLPNAIAKMRELGCPEVRP